MLLFVAHSLVDIEKLKAGTDILQVIGQSVRLHRTGPLYRGLCPFHRDTTPSLTVYVHTQSFYCFGCGASGDIIDWVRRFYALEFKEAIEFLQNEQGSFAQRLEPAPKVYRAATKVIPITMAQYWHAQLGDRRSYFHERGFNDETIDRELWGWNGQRYVLTVWRDLPQESPLLQVRLRRSNGDPNAAKYIGLTGFNRAHLYNVWAIRDQPRVFIFFGEFDAALATQFGLPSCSPTNGMRAWEDEWNEHLKGISEIYLVPDKGEEEAGFRTRAAIGLHVKMKFLPDVGFNGKDFTDWILEGHSVSEFLEESWRWKRKRRILDG